jgi:hypothetical protein
MQAWRHYGTMWPVVHQQLGVSPDLGNGRLDVVPQVPSSGPVAASAIRLGGGSIDVRAAHDGRRYETVVRRSLAVALTVGHVVPAGARVAAVTLDGAPARYVVRDTHRGREVLVTAGRSGRSATTDRLVVTLA